MMSPGQRWFLSRSVWARGVMSRCLSRCYLGHEGSITEASMSWVGKAGQQLDKTVYRIPVDFALLRRKDDPSNQTEHALFRQMLHAFPPPAWCQEVVVVADARLVENLC